jgi:formylglycine-generating enzyme required for sulfatase activity
MDSGEILPVMAGLITRETMRLTDGRQRPYQNGSIVSELYYSLGGQVQPQGGGSVAATTVLNSPTRGPEETLPAPSPVMVSVASGTFAMGSNGLEFDRAPFGETLRQVRLSAFYLSAKTVSVGEFRRFAEETGHVSTAEAEGGALAYNDRGEWEFRAGGNWRNPGFAQGDDHPVVNVSWFDAVRYCNWLSAKEGLRPAYTVSGVNVSWDKTANGYRLPTEAEWEYACRAGTTGPFFTGTRISTAQANYNGNLPYHTGNRGLFRKTTTPAGSFPPNEWGIYDMHGNVWEWCWDYNSIPRASSTVIVNPSGDVTGTSRINRGGAWASAGNWLRSAARDSDLPETASGNLGFRLARNN